MPDLDLDAAQALTDAATEGPWEVDLKGCCVFGRDGWEVLEGSSDRNTTFIAWARTGVPQLIARIRELERQASDK